MEQRQFERKRKAPWAEDNEPGHLIPAPESGQEVRTAMEYLDLKLMEMKREKTKRPSAYIKPTEKQVTVMKRLQNAKSSRFCHICTRSSKEGEHVKCTNLRHGMCRKIVCLKCISEVKWDWGFGANASATEWLCTHCRNFCPEKAQCNTYQRINKKRKLTNTEKGSEEPSGCIRKFQI